MRQQPLQWHPAFQAAMQIELAEYQDWLKYEREHNLTQKPLQIDLLIIKMEQGRQIEKSIGRLFRRRRCDRSGRCFFRGSVRRVVGLCWGFCRFF